MRWVAFVLATLTAPAASAAMPADRGLVRCEAAAELVTDAHILHPVDAAARTAYINTERARIGGSSPERRPDDQDLMAAYSSVTFQLVELNLQDSPKPLSRETQLRLAARAGAACGLLQGRRGAP